MSQREKQQEKIKSGGKKTTVRSRIRPVGNSKGVILNNHLLKTAGISLDEDISIEASNGLITISQVKPTINTDLSSWDTQFKKAINAGNKPERDLFEGMENEFDKTDW